MMRRDLLVKMARASYEYGLQPGAWDYLDDRGQRTMLSRMRRVLLMLIEEGHMPDRLPREPKVEP